MNSLLGEVFGLLGALLEVFAGSRNEFGAVSEVFDGLSVGLARI